MSIWNCVLLLWILLFVLTSYKVLFVAFLMLYYLFLLILYHYYSYFSFSCRITFPVKEKSLQQFCKVWTERLYICGSITSRLGQRILERLDTVPPLIPNVRCCNSYFRSSLIRLSILLPKCVFNNGELQ